MMPGITGTGTVLASTTVPGASYWGGEKSYQGTSMQTGTWARRARQVCVISLGGG